MRDDRRREIVVAFRGSRELENMVTGTRFVPLYPSARSRLIICVFCRWQPRADPARIARHREEHGFGTRRLSDLVQLCARRRGACRA